MEKKTQDFSIKEAQRLANSPAGKELIGLLRRGDSAAVQKAIELAAAGDYAAAGKALNALLSSPEAQKLMQQLGGNHGGL